MSGRERQILYDITYMWNPKHTTNKYNKKETDSQTEEKVHGYQCGEGRREGQWD